MRFGVESGKGHDGENLRPEFMDAPHVRRVHSAVTGRWTYVAAGREQSKRMCVSVSVTVLAMAIAVVAIILVFALRLRLIDLAPDTSAAATAAAAAAAAATNTTPTVPTSAVADTASILVNSAWVGTGNALWQTTAVALTAYETQASLAAHHVSLVFKTSLFRIINTYFSLFYLAAKIGQHIVINGRNDDCVLVDGQPNCLADLFQQLGMQLVVNWLSMGVFVHLVPSLLSCAVLYCKTVKHHLGRVGAEEAAGASPRALLARGAESVAEGVACVRRGEANTCTPGELWLRVNVEAQAPEFQDSPLFMIQLLNAGYVMLFSPAFSLAPVLAMATNAVSGVMDLDLALRRSARSIPVGSDELGAWVKLFELLSLMSVLTNSLVISFTTKNSLFAVPGWSDTAARMGWFIVAETVLFATKYIAASYLPKRTEDVELQVKRGEYLLAKHLKGVRDPAAVPADPMRQKKKNA
jgi:hypothetical protein